MSAHILDGKQLAATLRHDLKQQIQHRLSQGLIAPGLAVVLVGDDPASKIYVRNKHLACQEIGIKAQDFHLPGSTNEQTLLALIDTLNADPAIHGILVQLPLPAHINPEHIIERIAPSKDVDGFHPFTIGCLAQRRPSLRPCTPYGVITLLRHYQITLEGIDATIVGASNIVGRPMGLELLLAGSTVTTCHRFTRDLATHIRQADLLVVAIGKPGIIQSDWIKPGAVVVDVGISRDSHGRICGDIAFDSAKLRASWITPVPGGVGPMTIACLMQNTLLASELSTTPNRLAASIL
jgi:methylenetetrahydrofolate dehydrogenase (NADP+) / methenyltetrahydrofolate cyclohydrolase